MRRLALFLSVGFVLTATPVFAKDMLRSQGDWRLVGTSDDVFTVEDGALQAKRRSYQSATIVTQEEFENFEASFEFRVGRWCELVFMIHAPWNEAWEAGLQLMLSDHEGRAPDPYTAGALLGHVAPKSNPVKKDGKWNACSIRMDWPSLTVDLNGERVQDVDLSAHEGLKYKLRRGSLGFRDLLGWGFDVRKFEIKELKDTEGAIRLFNGKNLDGWREVRKRDAKWRVENGVIVGDDGNGYLQHEQVCEDFELRLYYKTTPTANGGVFFRWLPDDSDRGNEIQILDVREITMPSGSIYGIDRADPAPIRNEDWNLLQVFVEGAYAVTHMNGVKVAETDRLTKVRPGLITLQMHKERSTIWFDDLYLVVRPSRP